MSNWKPTEGQRRADLLMLGLRIEAHANGDLPWGCPMMQSRLFDAVSKALDQALADGAERDALDSTVGNGHVEWAGQMGPLVQVPATDGVGLNDIFSQSPAPEPDGHALGAALSEGLKASLETGGYIARAKALGWDPDNPDAPPIAISIAPKKRGRPKGAKGKKAKAAKAAKVKAEPVVSDSAIDLVEPVAVPAEEAAP